MAALAAGYVIGALDRDEQRAFEAHLEECAACAADVASFSRVLPELAASVPDVAPPLDLRGRVLASVRAATPAPTSVAVTHFEPRRRSVVGMWLPVAALLTLALGLGAYSLTLRQRIVTLE